LLFISSGERRERERREGESGEEEREGQLTVLLVKELIVLRGIACRCHHLNHHQ